MIFSKQALYWMTEPSTKGRTKRLLIGAVAGVLGIAFFVILHNVFYALGAMPRDVALPGRFLGFLGETCFVLALLACPAAAVACLVWALINRLAGRATTMTRLILLGVVPALTAATAGCFFPQPLLNMSIQEVDEAAGFNGSFEFVKSGYPANWYFSRRQLENGDCEITFDTADKVDGTQSLRFVVRKANPGGGWPSPGLFQSLPAQEGRAYRISFWLKTREAVIRLRICSEALNPSPNPIIDSINAEDGWRQFVYTYTVPARHDSIRFEINIIAPGTAWIDNVRIDPL